MGGGAGRLSICGARGPSKAPANAYGAGAGVLRIPARKFRVIGAGGCRTPGTGGW